MTVLIRGYCCRSHEQVADVSLDVQWLICLAVVNNRNSLAVDEKLLEVPAYVVCFDVTVVETMFRREMHIDRWAVALEKGEERVFVRSIDVNFFRQFKVWFESAAWSNILETVDDLCAVFTWLLQSKLVAGNSEDAEILEAVLECIHCEVLVRGASERRDVDEEDDIAAVLGPVDRLLAVNILDLVVVDCPVAAARVITQHFTDCLDVRRTVSGGENCRNCKQDSHPISG